MIRFKTFLESKKTVSYIDHNDKKQIVDLSMYKLDKYGDYILNHSSHHSFSDLPRIINPPPDLTFNWINDGNYHRDNNLPADIEQANPMIMRWSVNGNQHRTNGPAYILYYRQDQFSSQADFHINDKEIPEEIFVKEYLENILLRIKEHPKDIRWYEFPNFELQKIALIQNPSVIKYIKYLHPDLKKTQHGTAQSVGLLDD